MPAALNPALVVLLPTLLFVALPFWISNFCGGRATLYTSFPVWRFRNIPDLTGKVAIVTGANTGIGYVSARELARKGAKVVVAARSEDRGKDAVKRIQQELKDVPGAANRVEFLKLDLGSFNSVRGFVWQFKKRYSSLDILLNNAGIMAVPQPELTVDGFESQIGVNHLGHFLLTKLLLSMLKNSKGRVVSVSSLAHIIGDIRLESFRNVSKYDPWAAYGQSKLANVLFCNEFTRRMEGTGVTCNSLHPGSIRTELTRHVEKSMSDMAVAIGEVLTVPFLMNPDDGALTQLYVATAPELAGVSGEYFTPTAAKGRATARGRNATLAKLLWEESERLTR
jgi:NAD(P)-dependent dehydrogenase (short-subunit alcohol dehydrogenase family)